MTKLRNILKGSIKNIINNKLRSLLTMLGLVIGIASVIVLVGIGNGTSSKISSQVQSLGADILTVKIQSSDYSLDYSQVNDIQSINNVEVVAPYKSVSSTVSREGSTFSRASIIATTPDYLDVMGLTISAGRLLSVRLLFELSYLSIYLVSFTRASSLSVLP